MCLLLLGVGTNMRLLLNLSPRRAFRWLYYGRVTCFGHEVEEFLSSTAKVFERQHKPHILTT